MDKKDGYGGLGTWRRYKLGQAQFTNWLKQTSEKLATKPAAADQDLEVIDAASISTESKSSKKKKEGQGEGISSGRQCLRHRCPLESARDNGNHHCRAG